MVVITSVIVILKFSSFQLAQTVYTYISLSFIFLSFLLLRLRRSLANASLTIGLQQLIWEITSCKGVSPAGVISSEMAPNTCPIRIGACDGQLMIYNTAVLDPKLTFPEDAANDAKVGDTSTEESDINDGLTLRDDPFLLKDLEGHNQFASVDIAVKFLSSVGLDFETTPSYTFDVIVKDGGYGDVSKKLSATQSVTVLIMNVNEQPLLREHGVAVSEA